MEERNEFNPDHKPLVAQLADVSEHTGERPDYDEVSEAQIDFLKNPEDTAAARRLVAALIRQGKPFPDDLQERALRLELRDQPFDQALTYSLVALLCRLGRQPIPDADIRGFASANLAPIEPGVDDLISSGFALALKGDTIGLYAALWQACLRFPRTSRGWAEYGRSFAERGDWSGCRAALAQILANDIPLDVATAESVIEALGTLAEAGQLGDFSWHRLVDVLPSSLGDHPQLSNLFLRVNFFDRAKAVIAQARTQRSQDATTWIVASRVAYEAENFSDAYEHFLRALDLDFPGTLRTVIRTFDARTGHMIDKLSKTKELEAWLSKKTSAYEDANLIPAWPSPEALGAARKFRREALDRGLPSAMLVTLGKSASVTIGNIFSSGFGLPTVLYSLVNAPAIPAWVDDFVRGGAYYCTHLNPSDRHIDILAAAEPSSIIVHVRDPRQQMISMVEHIRRYSSMTPASMRARIGNGQRQEIAYAIEEEFPSTLAWIEGWVTASRRLNVHFTTFEEFIRDRDQFVERLLSLYGGDVRHFDRKSGLEEHAGIDYHRRLGEIDEWRSLLLPEQIELVNSLIPNEFWRLFGWTP